MTTVHFAGGPWDGQTYEADRVVGPVFAVGHETGNRYWLDTKSDPPTYYWDAERPEHSDGPVPPVTPVVGNDPAESSRETSALTDGTPHGD